MSKSFIYRKKIGACLMRLAFPNVMVEIISRLAGYISDFIYFDMGQFGEARVRAMILNLKYGFSAHTIGRGVILDGASRIDLAPGSVLHHGVIIVAGRTGYCKIGAHSHVSHYSVLAATHGITIGEQTSVSSGVAIYSASNQKIHGLRLTDAPLRTAPVEIRDRVLIGANAMIMPGVVIQNDCAVGANAVVTKDVEERMIVAGVPARQINKNPASDAASSTR